VGAIRIHSRRVTVAGVVLLALLTLFATTAQAHAHQLLIGFNLLAALSLGPLVLRAAVPTSERSRSESH
jgi:hypothetical protein